MPTEHARAAAVRRQKADALACTASGGPPTPPKERLSPLPRSERSSEDAQPTSGYLSGGETGAKGGNPGGAPGAAPRQADVGGPAPPAETPAATLPRPSETNLPLTVRRRVAQSDAVIAGALDAGALTRAAAWPPLPAELTAPLSIADEYAGATIFLTGATGYIGSVVLEKLLRCTSAARIVCLVRGKRGQDPAARLDKLFATRSLFNALKAGADELPVAVRARVGVAVGDAQAERLGLSDGDWETITATTTHIIHCAASISFDAPVHALLSQNYDATAAVLALARACRSLRAHVHVSTCYVNGHLPRGALVHERTYDLAMPDGRPLDHAALADELRAADAAGAERKVAAVLATCGGANAYTLTKHMSERLVLAAAADPTFKAGVAVVRPSIVGACAHAPAAGYIGNSAGATAIFLAFATCLIRHTPFRAYSVIDNIPGDIVGNAIIGAGAAASAAHRRGKPADAPPLILHAASSTTNPVTHVELLRSHLGPYYAARPAPVRFRWRYPTLATSDVNYCRNRSLTLRALLAFDTAKFYVASRLLKLAGSPLGDKLWAGWTACATVNTADLDFGLLFSARNAAALEARLAPAEAAAFPMTWRADRPSDALGPYMRTYLAEMGARYFGQSREAGVAAPARRSTTLSLPPPLLALVALCAAAGAVTGTPLLLAAAALVALAAHARRGKVA